MGHELEQDAETLRGIVGQLNAATAEATEVVAAVDEFLGDELRLGVSAASRAFDTQRVLGEEAVETIVTSHLAYGRIEGKDRLHVLKATHQKNEWNEDFTRTAAEERIPWSGCSREVKLQSFARLPELLATLAGRADEVSSQTSRTVTAVRGLLDAMRRSPQTPVEPPAEPVGRVATAADDEPYSDPVGIDESYPEPADDFEGLDEPRPVPLHELTASAAPSLFRRPRPKS